MLSSFRHLVAGVLAVAAAAGIVAGLTARRAHDELLDSAAFAGSARGALEDREVRSALAQVVTDQLMAPLSRVSGVPAGGDALAEPVVRRAVQRVVATETFEDVFAAAVEDAHASVVDHPGGEVVLDLSGSADVLQAELVGSTPLPAGAGMPVEALSDIRVGSGTQLPDLREVDDGVEAASTWPLLVGVVALAAAVAVSPAPWGAVAATGIFVAVGGGLVWLLAAVGPGLVLDRLPDADVRTVANGIVDEAMAGVRFQAGAMALVAGAAGLVALVLAARPRRALVV